jgi:hypothetical protein
MRNVGSTCESMPHISPSSSRARRMLTNTSHQLGSVRVVASLDRKRLGGGALWKRESYIRGVFDEETRRKPLASAADALSYGI